MAITSEEKQVAVLMALGGYIPLMVLAVRNLYLHYRRERQKIFNFIPTVNILLFTCIYSNHF